MGDDTLTATVPAPATVQPAETLFGRTEEQMTDELAELLFRVKMLEFDLRRMRDPRGPAYSCPSPAGEVDVERKIAEGRARSLAKLEAKL